MAVPLLFGIIGTAVLLALGVWQLQRLAWKNEVVALIDARMAAAPGPVPVETTEADHEYLLVRLSGRVEPGELHVLTTGRGVGYRVIAPLLLGDGRRVLLDRGFVADTAKDASRPLGPVEVEGALLWPDETDGFTPAPDIERNIWFAREVDAMAAALETEPVLVVASKLSLEGSAPVPVVAAVRNSHLEYAITWFGLAAVWSVMTLHLLWRIKRRID
jgi:surfeit locus 1 family protein